MLSAGPNLNDLISCIECSTVLKSHMPQIVYCLSTQKNRQRPFVHQPSFIQSILPFVCFFHPSFYRSNHHPFVCLSVHPSTHPSVCPPTHPFVHSLFHPSVCLSVLPSSHPFILSILSFIHPPIRSPSVCCHCLDEMSNICFGFTKCKLLSVHFICFSCFHLKARHASSVGKLR